MYVGYDLMDPCEAGLIMPISVAEIDFYTGVKRSNLDAGVENIRGSISPNPSCAYASYKTINLIDTGTTEASQTGAE